jgi:hypothetical protein
MLQLSGAVALSPEDISLIGQLPSLTALDISCSASHPPSDALSAPEALSPLAHLQALQSLDLSHHAAVTDAGFACLLSLTGLTALRMTGTQFGATCAAACAHMPLLRGLEIGQCHLVRDAHLDLLGSRCTALVHACIGGCPMVRSCMHTHVATACRC